MSLRGVYQSALGLSVLLALTSVLLGGQLAMTSWVVVPMVLGLWVWQLYGRVVSAWAGTLLALCGLLIGLGVLLAHGASAAVPAGTYALMGILVGRMASAQDLSHGLQVLLLALLLMFAGSVLNMELSYGLLFVGFSLCAAWTLVTRQLLLGAIDEARRRYRRGGQEDFEPQEVDRFDVVSPSFMLGTASLTLALLVTTGLLFLLFPRMGILSLGGLSQGSERFPSGVSLLGAPRAAGGGEVMARVTGISEEVFEEGLYLRGPVYDRLTSEGFDRSENTEHLVPPVLQPSHSGPAISYEVFVQPVLGRLLPALGRVDRASVLAGGNANPSLRTRLIGTGPQGELLSYRPLTGPLRYQVRGWLSSRTETLPMSSPGPLRGDMLEHYTRMPDEMDRRIPAMAEDVLWRAGLTPQDPASKRAKALRQHLVQNYQYTLAQPNGASPDPLARFLFEDPRGHCEYFATAYAVLLRAARIPSRVVGGFAGGAWLQVDDPVVVFFRRNAHAWVEWYDPAAGWVTDDATPASGLLPRRLVGLRAAWQRMSRVWDDYIVDYGAQQQLALLRQAFTRPTRAIQTNRNLWPWALGGLGLLLLGMWFARRRRHRGAQDRRSSLLARELLAWLEQQRGTSPPCGMTLREAVQSVNLDPSERAIVGRILTDYEAERFGSGELPAQVVKAHVRELRRLRRSFGRDRDRTTLRTHPGVG